MNRVFENIGRMTMALTVALTALSITLTTAAPAQAQSTSKPPASTAKKKVVKKKAAPRKKSTAERQADAFRRLKDYNYVKSMSPYAGSPNKWGPKW